MVGLKTVAERIPPSMMMVQHLNTLFSWNISYSADDEVIGHSTSDSHWDIGDGILQSKYFDKQHHGSHANKEKIKHMRSDDANKVKCSWRRR